jgi:hypothetical protein
MSQITLMQLLDGNKQQLEKMPLGFYEALSAGALYYRKDESFVLADRRNVSNSAETKAEVVTELKKNYRSMTDKLGSLVGNLVRAEKASHQIEIHVKVPFLNLDMMVTPTVAVKLRSLFKSLAERTRYKEFNTSNSSVDTSNSSFAGWVEERMFSQVEMYDNKAQLETALQDIQTQLTVKNVQTLVDM